MHPGALQRVIAQTEPPSLARSAKSAYYSAATALFSGRQRHLAFWENMLRLGWGRPLLYLYSADDPLCDGSKVDELLQQKRAAGQRVSARRWQKSGHVMHFRHHREEYTALLLGFLAEAAADVAADVAADGRQQQEQQEQQQLGATPGQAAAQQVLARQPVGSATLPRSRL